MSSSRARVFALLAAVAPAACFAPAGTGGTQIPLAAVAAPNAKTGRLVYVSDYSANVVQIYAYPSGTLDGTLSGPLANPQGLCTDAGGHNLFVSNTGDENVLEYAWGAASPHATYGDADEFPVACSLDPSTGKLAIADIFSPTTGLGAVTVCTKPARCKVYVEPAGLVECFAVAYLPGGGLYASGFSASGDAVAYLAAGGSSWQPVIVKGGPIDAVVQWDGQFLAAGGSGGSSSFVLYRCAPNGPSLACDDRRVELTGGGAAQLFVKYGGKGIVGTDNRNGDILTWPYPAGGKPSKVIHAGKGSYSTLVGTALLRQP